MDTGTANAQANEQQVGGDHYKKNAVQTWDFITANNIPFLEGNVIKYISRWRSKGGLDDLYKARHYLTKIIENEAVRLEAEMIRELSIDPSIKQVDPRQIIPQRYSPIPGVVDSASLNKVWLDNQKLTPATATVYPPSLFTRVKEFFL